MEFTSHVANKVKHPYVGVDVDWAFMIQVALFKFVFEIYCGSLKSFP